MNQAYRIGDQVVIVRTAEFSETDKDGKLELVFRDGRGKADGYAVIAKECVIANGNDYLISAIGYVMGASYSFLKRETDYEISFEDSKRDLVGYARVPESIVSLPSAQRLRKEDIEALNQRGVAV